VSSNVTGSVTNKGAKLYIGASNPPDPISPHAGNTPVDDASVLVFIEKRFYLGVGVAFACA